MPTGNYWLNLIEIEEYLHKLAGYLYKAVDGREYTHKEFTSVVPDLLRMFFSKHSEYAAYLNMTRVDIVSTTAVVGKDTYYRPHRVVVECSGQVVTVP